MICLSLDPGKRTGWCIGYLNGEVFRIEPGEDELSLSAMYKRLSEALDNGTEHIIYEDFVYANAPKSKVDYTPVKVIGIIELYREWHEPMIQFYRQSPAAGKAFYIDDRLKELGVYWAHGKGHARDATRHLLQWANFGAGAQYIDMSKVKLELV